MTEPRLILRLSEPMQVVRGEGGLVGAWVPDEDGRAVGLIFEPAAAEETGLQLRMKARDQRFTPPLPAAEVIEVAFTPPIDPMCSGLLSLTFEDGRRADLMVGLAGLQQFADAASQALAAVLPAGRS